MNPTVQPEFFEAEQQRDPESFRSEYLAEFVGSGGAFLDPAVIEAAVADREELLPEHASGWTAGLDPAFASDPFGLALVGRRDGRLVLGRVQAWTPNRRWFRKPESFEERREVEDEVLAEVAEVCKRYGARVVTDQYAAPQVVARLRELGLSVQAIPMTASSKTASFQELRARLNMGELELYREQQLLAELGRLRTKYAAGSSSVVNPRVGGSHGDLAQALALAVYAMRGGEPLFEFDGDDKIELPAVAA
jgi:phage terminase large subunit-like protein